MVITISFTIKVANDLRNLEKEYPILKEHRRRKESKNKNIKSLIILVPELFIEFS